MERPGPDVAGVILHRGATETTVRCLQSLREAARPGRGTVLVVDNTRRLDVYHDVTDDPGRASIRIYYSTRNLIEVMRKHASWYNWFSFGVNFLTRWLGFFAVLALVRGQPRDVMALMRGMIDFARRRFGESPWVDDARAERTTPAAQA